MCSGVNLGVVSTSCTLTFVEGVDFFTYDDPVLVAQKVALVVCAEVAATGDRVVGGRVVVHADVEGWAESFARGLRSSCADFGIKVDGIEFVPGHFGVQFDAWGEDGPRLSRYGAMPGDFLCVSGVLGGAELGFRQRKSMKEGLEFVNEWETRYMKPEIRPKLGLAIRNLATSCAASYNGFLSAARGMALESGVDFVICRCDLPVFEGVDVADFRGDCELLFTFPPGKSHVIALSGEPVSIIGSVAEGEGNVRLE